MIDQVANDGNQQKGEFVVLIEGYLATKETAVTELEASIMRVLLQELSTKQAASIGAKLTGLKKRDLYQWALENSNH